MNSADEKSAGEKSLHHKLVAGEKKSVDSYNSGHRKGSRTLMCAVDGSSGAESAFRAMMLMRRQLDHVCVFHTYSKEKDASCPSIFKNDEIREHYVQELTTTHNLPTTKFSFLWEDRKGRSVNEVIGDMLEGYKGIRNPMSPTQQAPDIFICGFAGRKRSYSSVDECDSPGIADYATGLGTTADFACRNLFMPTIVVKYTPVFEDDTRCIVVAIDGSTGSRKAFNLAVSLLTPKDKIRCVSVTPMPNDEDARQLAKSVDDIREEYEAAFSHVHVKDCTFESISCEDRSNVAETICEYGVHHGADFLCIAPRAEATLSSVTEYILVHSHCSIILAKS